MRKGRSAYPRGRNFSNSGEMTEYSKHLRKHTVHCQNTTQSRYSPPEESVKSRLPSSRASAHRASFDMGPCYTYARRLSDFENVETLLTSSKILSSSGVALKKEMSYITQNLCWPYVIGENKRIDLQMSHLALRWRMGHASSERSSWRTAGIWQGGDSTTVKRVAGATRVSCHTKCPFPRDTNGPLVKTLSLTTCLWCGDS